MKRKLSGIFLCSLASTVFLLSCQKEISNGDDSAIPSIANSSSAREDHARPFKGTYTTTNQVLQGPPFLQQRITGNGSATHLGESMFVALATLNLTTQPPFGITGTTVFSADNGDEFYTQFTGTSTPIGNGQSAVVVNHEITGGTGRFKIAGGTFVGNAIANPAASTGSISYVGTITY